MREVTRPGHHIGHWIDNVMPPGMLPGRGCSSVRGLGCGHRWGNAATIAVRCPDKLMTQALSVRSGLRTLRSCYGDFGNVVAVCHGLPVRMSELLPSLS